RPPPAPQSNQPPPRFSRRAFLTSLGGLAAAGVAGGAVFFLRGTASPGSGAIATATAQPLVAGGRPPTGQPAGGSAPLATATSQPAPTRSPATPTALAATQPSVGAAPSPVAPITTVTPLPTATPGIL